MPMFIFNLFNCFSVSHLLLSLVS